MNIRKSFIKSKLNKRLKRMDLILRTLILLLVVLVIYDSFIHHTPLYYILFFVLGQIIAKAFKGTMFVQANDMNDSLELRSNLMYIIITILLLIFKFFLGKKVFESFHIVWVSDALYLFFLGIYSEKYKNLLRQIDDLFYKRISDKKTD